MSDERREAQTDKQPESVFAEAPEAPNTGASGDKILPQSRCCNPAESEKVARAGFTADYLYRCCDKSFQMELDRYQSLTATVARLIACISIIAVAIMTAASLLAPAFDTAGKSQLLAWCCLVVFAPLIGSLVTALCSQFRFRYKALASPGSFASSVAEYESDFENACEAAIQYAKTLEPCYESLRGRNETIRRLLKASTICLLVCLGLVVASSILGCGILLL